MENMRAIRSRIKSITNTQQITKAMKMVSASKLRKVSNTMNTMLAFDEDNQKILNNLLSSNSSAEDFEHVLLAPRKEILKTAYVIFVGNRGLCGTYNSSLLRFLIQVLDKEEKPYDLIVCGKWGTEVFKKFDIPVAMTFDELSDTPNQQEAVLVSEYLTDAFLSKEYDEIHLIYQKYVSALQQEPADFTFLPFTLTSGDDAPSGSDPVSDILFLPDANTVMDKFLKIYTTSKLYSIMLEARCGEHTARVNAMTSASDSTEKLISKLKMHYNMARQSAITNELSEIVGGAAALKK